jgi:predicted dehydrogenase
VGDEATTPLPRSGSVQFSARIRAAEGDRGQSRAGAAARGAAVTTEATFLAAGGVRQNANALAKVSGVERLSVSGPPALDGEREVILATPTQMHAAQALQCLEAGKHVQVEIPLPTA